MQNFFGFEKIRKINPGTQEFGSAIHFASDPAFKTVAIKKGAFEGTT